MPHTPREFSYFIIIIETLYWATVCRITHIDVHLAKGGKKKLFYASCTQQHLSPYLREHNCLDMGGSAELTHLRFLLFTCFISK